MHTPNFQTLLSAKPLILSGLPLIQARLTLMLAELRMELLKCFKTLVNSKHSKLLSQMMAFSGVDFLQSRVKSLSLSTTGKNSTLFVGLMLLRQLNKLSGQMMVRK
jgi:hypothetical protein